MKFEEKELEKQKEAIQKDVYEVFRNHMNIFGLDIPENDENKSASLILEAMDEAIKEIRRVYLNI